MRSNIPLPPLETVISSANSKTIPNLPVPPHFPPTFRIHNADVCMQGSNPGLLQELPWPFGVLTNLLTHIHDLVLFRFVPTYIYAELNTHIIALMFYPCLFSPSDNVWRSPRADRPRCSKL